MIDFIKKLKARSARVRRHAAAMFRYPTIGRFWNLAVVETERMLGREVVRGRPYILLIDPLNTCNLRCPFCATGQGNLPLKPGKMKLDSFKSLIDEIAPHTFKIDLYNWGEPFLHKDILPMVAHAHKRRISTAISSNLNVLPQGGGEAVVRSGLDDLVVSCDGLTQETYEQYRVQGKLENVVRNLKEITDARRRLGRKNPHIEFQFLVFKHNEHEVPRVHAFAKGLGADIVRIQKPFVNIESESIRPADNPDFVRSEYLDEEKDQSDRLDIFSPKADQEACAAANPPPIKCFWPWRSTVINWGGQVDPCCGKNYLDSFGNVFEKPFAEIWNGPEYRYARRWITGKAGEDEEQAVVCRGCGGYG
ncbi:radical SAM protein [bacterium]|nr:radical SAM protein [bacterium]